MGMYRYFVSGVFSDRHGAPGYFRHEIIRGSKIASVDEDIRELEELLEREFGYKRALIQNFILLDSWEENMDNAKFLEVCTQKVVDYFNSRKDKTDNVLITTNDVFVVWSCKTLQNNKALLSTTVPDGMYYELTYNGDKKELYMDAYKKLENICFEGVE